MKNQKSHLVRGAIFVSVLGTLLHFFYAFSGQSFLVGLFAPINESVWEHMKLIFFPMLLFAACTKKSHPNTFYPILRGAIIGTLLIPTIFYTYTGILGTHFAFLDILTFYISVLASFLTIFKSSNRQISKKRKRWILLLVSFFVISFFIFSIFPPSLGIFAPPAM